MNNLTPLLHLIKKNVNNWLKLWRRLFRYNLMEYMGIRRGKIMEGGDQLVKEK
jgi:hypothetical protein